MQSVIVQLLWSLCSSTTVTDAGRANTYMRKFKAPRLQTKVQKMKDVQKMSFTEKPFEDFRRKKYNSSIY